MNKLSEITPKFVDLIPADPESGVLYISKKYNTAVHMCCCGCGNKVVTPLKPGQWSLTVANNEKVSLSPSIGNWNFTCQSHYWIKSNKVDWSSGFTKEQIEAVRRRDRQALKEEHERNVPTLWQRIKRWLARLFGF